MANHHLRAVIVPSAYTDQAHPHATWRRRLNWAELLKRVFAADVLACPCGGRRTVTAFVVNTNLAHSVLTALGWPPSPPPSHRHVTHPRPSSPGTTPHSRGTPGRRSSGSQSTFAGMGWSALAPSYGMAPYASRP